MPLNVKALVSDLLLVTTGTLSAYSSSRPSMEPSVSYVSCILQSLAEDCRSGGKCWTIMFENDCLFFSVSLNCTNFLYPPRWWTAKQGIAYIHWYELCNQGRLWPIVHRVTWNEWPSFVQNSCRPAHLQFLVLSMRFWVNFVREMGIIESSVKQSTFVHGTHHW